MAGKHNRMKAPKDQVMAFKVDAQLASLLASVKNKSELIRDAVYAYLGHLCPLCEGKGTIPANRSHEIELLLKQLEFAACSGCHTPLPVMPCTIPSSMAVSKMAAMPMVAPLGFQRLMARRCVNIRMLPY